MIEDDFHGIIIDLIKENENKFITLFL